MFDFSIYNIIFLLITTHITILTVTIYLHRSVAHRSLFLAKPVEHFFRLWCWLTTGQSSKEWAAVHRKHHAKCETQEDPHSPQIYGVWNILFKGVAYYRKEAKNPQTLERYGKLTPNDKLEQFYQNHSQLGLVILFFIFVGLFGWNGIWMYLIQIAWIPFWAAGVVNGIGHFWGYKNFSPKDESRNLFPWGIIIGGEELHNNHHANPASAKLSVKWYEFDMGWLWIKLLSYLKLATINNVYTLPKSQNNTCFNLNEFLKHRLYIDSLYKKYTFKTVWFNSKNQINISKKQLKHIFYKQEQELTEQEKNIVNNLISNQQVQHIYHIKEKLLNLWENKTLSLPEIDWHLKEILSDIKTKQQQSMIKFYNKIEKTFQPQVSIA